MAIADRRCYVTMSVSRRLRSPTLSLQDSTINDIMYAVKKHCKLEGARESAYLRQVNFYRRHVLGVISGPSLGTRVSNLKSVALTVLELLAFNAQIFWGSRDHGHAPFEKIFGGHVRTVPSLGTRMSNLKSIGLTVLELLAVIAQKLWGLRDHGHAPFWGNFWGSCQDCPWEQVCQI